MKPSTELFDLIKSLTKSEKRFFKLSSSLQSGEKNYLKIFDAIDKQSVYNEDAVKEKFKDESFISHFPSEKNHLYKLLLKSLRNFHADASVSSVLTQEIKNIEILYKKALYKECYKFLKRAKKLAWEHEKFYYLFELINWEKILIEESYKAGEFFVSPLEIMEEEKQVLKKLQNLAEYHMLYSEINYLFKNKGYVRNKEEYDILEKISGHPLIVGKNTALSVRATSICYYIQGFSFWAKGDREKSFETFNKVKLVLDKSPTIKEDLAKRYVRACRGILNYYVYKRDYDEAVSMINFMKSLSEKPGFDTVDVQILLFSATNISHMYLLFKTGKVNEGLALIDEVTPKLTEWEDKIPKESQILFYFSIAFLQFLAGKYKDALSWINELLNDNEKNLRQDLYAFARIFNLIIHFELGNFDLLEYTLKSTQRYLNKRDLIYEFEQVFLEHFKKVLRSNESSDKKIQSFSKFKTSIVELSKDPYQKVVLEYFDLMSWLDSKIKQKPFAELVAEK
jgi:tetratricopeptide (TPR) repeat protein